MVRYYKMDDSLSLRRTHLLKIYRALILFLSVTLLFVLMELSTREPRSDVKDVAITLVDTIYVAADDTMPLTKENLWAFINECDILFPEVVFQQFMGESNHLKSKSCLVANNLGGFKVEPSSRYKNTYHIRGVKYLDHLVFPSWKHCVMHYKEFQKTNFTNQNYYRFLENQGYATSPLYIKLLKSIEVPCSLKKNK